MKITHLRFLFLLVVLFVILVLHSAGANDEKVILPVATDYEYAATAEIKEIRVGFIHGVYEDMFIEAIMPSLEKMGYTVVPVYYDDHIRPNFALAQYEIDLNVFQHYAYLNNFKFENDLALSAITEIPTELGNMSAVNESFKVVAVRTKDLNKQFVRDIIEVTHSDDFRNIIVNPTGKYSGFQLPRSFYDTPFGIRRKKS